MTTLIMPTRNNKESFRQAMMSILETVDEEYKLIIVESESTDGTAQLADSYANNHEHIEVYHTKKAGLVKAFNFGMRKAKGDVCLIHDDVIFPRLYKKCWLRELKKLKGPNVGIITCVNGGGLSGPDYLNGLYWVGTWCMYIPEETRKEIGVLDGTFKVGDDIDYSYRVINAGKKIIIADFSVNHHRTGSHVEDQGDFHELVVKMGNKFKKKHNR